MTATPAHDHEQTLLVERALLGACIVNADAVDLADGLVALDDFVEPLHARLFEEMLAARAAGRRLDFRLLTVTIGKDADIKIGAGEMTIGDYLVMLMKETPSVINAPDYARTIRELAHYRQLGAISGELAERAGQGQLAGKPSVIATEVAAALDAIATAGVGSNLRRMSIGEAAKEALAELRDRKENGVVDGITWGLPEMNKATLGLHRRELTVLAARPGMGKTTAAANAARAAAMNGDGVALFSLEMGSVSLSNRVLSDLCYSESHSIPYHRIRGADISDDEMARLERATQKLESLPLEIEQQRSLNVSQIVSRSRSIANQMDRKGQRLGLIVVDHLGEISGADGGNRSHELGLITSRLYALGQELDASILLACQLNRGVEGRDSKRPSKSDLRDSGRIEEIADTVVFLYREAYYLQNQREKDPDKEAARLARLVDRQNIIEFIIDKQRHGPTAIVEAFCSMGNNAIRHLSRSGGF